jgi:hypothetical protein
MPFVANRVFGWEPVEITKDWGMRDIRCGMAYPLCNTLRCGSCGLVLLDIRFDEVEMSALYRGYRGSEYVAQRAKYEPDYRARNDALSLGASNIAQVEELLRPFAGSIARVLDWGGGTGQNTPFRREALVHHVFDISDSPLVDGAVRVDSDVAATEDYDLVVLSHVLEHLPYPRDTVAQVALTMGIDTLLWVSVPFEGIMRQSADSSSAYLQKHHWHEHVNFFTQDALSRLLASAGLLVVADRVLEVVVGGDTLYHMGAVCRLADAPPRGSTRS